MGQPYGIYILFVYFRVDCGAAGVDVGAFGRDKMCNRALASPFAVAVIVCTCVPRQHTPMGWSASATQPDGPEKSVDNDMIRDCMSTKRHVQSDASLCLAFLRPKWVHIHERLHVLHQGINIRRVLTGYTSAIKFLVNAGTLVSRSVHDKARLRHPK